MCFIIKKSKGYQKKKIVDDKNFVPNQNLTIIHIKTV